MASTLSVLAGEGNTRVLLGTGFSASTRITRMKNPPAKSASPGGFLAFLQNIFPHHNPVTPLSGMCLLGGDGIFDSIKSVVADAGGAAAKAAGAQTGQSIMNIFNKGDTASAPATADSGIPGWVLPAGIATGFLLLIVVVAKKKAA